MKKRVFGQKFSRAQKGRRALLRSLVRGFVLSGKMTTTLARAKFIRPVVDHLVTRAKKGGLENDRSLVAFFAQDEEAARLLQEASKKFKDRTSGFTSFVRLGARRGDRAPMVKISWTK